jgi:hypothetical protein
MFELGQQNGRLKQGEFNPNNAVMQFPVPGMPASGCKVYQPLLVFRASGTQARYYQHLAGFYASETLADLSDETHGIPRAGILPFR